MQRHSLVSWPRNSQHNSIVIPGKLAIASATRNPGISKPSDRGRGTAYAVPALRTVRAVFPHTALESVVSSSGLARQDTGCNHGEQPLSSEESIGPPQMVI